MDNYKVIDIQTGKVVATFKNFRNAARKADLLDNEYGGYRFSPCATYKTSVGPYRTHGPDTQRDGGQ